MHSEFGSRLVEASLPPCAARTLAALSEGLLSFLLFLSLPVTARAAELLSTGIPHPADWRGAPVTDTSATLSGDKWSSLRAPKEFAEVHISATVTIMEPAKSTRFFGQGWSAWPDATFSDGGFDAGRLLRAGTNSGYRVHLSHKYQVGALVKWPEGGYVRVGPCAVKLKEPHRLSVSAQRLARHRAGGRGGQARLGRHVSAADFGRGGHRRPRRSQGQIQRPLGRVAPFPDTDPGWPAHAALLGPNFPRRTAVRLRWR